MRRLLGLLSWDRWRSRAGLLFERWLVVLGHQSSLLEHTLLLLIDRDTHPPLAFTMDMSGMKMTSPTMAMATATPTPTMHMDMTTSTTDHSMSGGMTMSMADMAMVFFNSANTPLYTQSWTPKTAGQYAGTCIFLVILPIICRALLVLRCRFPAMMEKVHARKHADIFAQPPDDIDECKQAQTPHNKPFSIKESLLRGVLDTVLAFVGYML